MKKRMSGLNVVMVVTPNLSLNMKTFLKESWKAFKCTLVHRKHHFSWDGGYWVGPFVILTGRCECSKCYRKWTNDRGV